MITFIPVRFVSSVSILYFYSVALDCLMRASLVDYLVGDGFPAFFPSGRACLFSYRVSVGCSYGECYDENRRLCT